jgi:hypothetical protein
MSQIVFSIDFLADTDADTWLAYDDFIFARSFVLRVEVVEGCHISSHVIASFTSCQTLHVEFHFSTKAPIAQ